MIFEVDVAVDIQAIKNREADQSAHGHIVGDIQDQISLLAFSEFLDTLISWPHINTYVSIYGYISYI